MGQLRRASLYEQVLSRAARLATGGYCLWVSWMGATNQSAFRHAITSWKTVPDEWCVSLPQILSAAMCVVGLSLITGILLQIGIYCGMVVTLSETVTQTALLTRSEPALWFVGGKMMYVSFATLGKSILLLAAFTLLIEDLSLAQREKTDINFDG
jgi:hypothetical protein